ncbi:hypothetical protein L0Z65_01425 [Phaeobacter sp. BS52]
MLAETASDAAAQAVKFLRDGGPSIWAIAALSVITLALILWKIWRLALIGAWSRGKAGRAVAAFERGEQDAARDIVRGRAGHPLQSRRLRTGLRLHPARRSRPRGNRPRGEAASGLGQAPALARWN